MFLVAMTDRPLEMSPLFDTKQIRKRQYESGFATLITDGSFSHSSAAERGFELSEWLHFTNTDNDTRLIHLRFDRRQKELVIEKPIISGRPIYYCLSDGGDFYCATHISALRAVGVRIAENTRALPEFFVYRYVVPPTTLYANIFQLSAGERITVAIAPRNCAIRSKVGFEFWRNASPLSAESAPQSVRAGLTAAIDDLGPSRESLACLLSGGLDSSILYKLTHDQLDIQDSYSTSYPMEDSGADREKLYATTASAAFGTKHHHSIPTLPAFRSAFVEAIAAAEEPLHHLQSVLLFSIFNGGIPGGKSIVISGQGADGVFGLELHNQLFRAHKNAFAYRIAGANVISPALRLASRLTGKGLSFCERAIALRNEELDLDDPDHILYSLGKYGSEAWSCAHFGVDRTAIVRSRRECIEQCEGQSIYDMVTSLDVLGDVAVTQSIWSKLAERNSLKLYYPFNHESVLRSAAGIPWEGKLRSPKHILRGVARNVGVPNFIIERPKSGFGLNAGRWSRPSGVFGSFSELLSGVFDPDLVATFQSDDPVKAMTYWNMLNYVVWKRICIEGKSVSSTKDIVSLS